MTLTSPIGSYPYPALADVPNAQTFGQQLTSALDLTTIPRFASDAAVAAAIPSPTTGQCIMRTDIGYGVLMHWGHSRWIPESSLIAEVSNATTDFTFSSIPQYWSSLRIIGHGFRTSASVVSLAVGVRFNGDSGANYNWVADQLTLNASPVLNTGNSSLGSASWAQAFVIVGASSDGNGGGHTIIDIPGYSSSGPKRCGSAVTMWESGGNTVGLQSFVGYASTSTITSVTFAFGGNVVTSVNSMRLYGVA